MHRISDPKNKNVNLLFTVYRNTLFYRNKFLWLAIFSLSLVFFKSLRCIKLGKCRPLFRFDFSREETYCLSRQPLRKTQHSTESRISTSLKQEI